jgi:hypothetical protein
MTQHPGSRKGIKNKTLKPELTCQRCHLPKPREQVVDHICTQCRHEIDNKTTNANCPGCGVLKTKANTYLRPGGRIGSRCKKCEKRAGSVRLMIVRAKASGDPKAWVLKQIAATRRLWAEYEALLATIENGAL